MLKRIVIAAAVSLCTLTAQAETVLRAGTFLPPRGVWHEPFQKFIDQVNEEGKGLVQIRLVADPSSINPFQMGEALASGVVDMLNISAAFYTHMVPEADAHKLFNRPIAELRENGAVDLINRIHNEKMNAQFLTRWGEGVTYHIYTNKPLEGPNLDGFSMRGTPLYRPYFEALGADVVEMVGSEIHSAMDAGVVDGYSWPLWGIGDLGLLDVTDYRVDPGYYSAEISLLVNKDTWDRLDEEQRAFLNEQAIKFERAFLDFSAETTEAQLALQEEAGIEVITFSEEENRELVQTAYDAGWETVIRNSPQYGEQLMELTYEPIE